VLKSKSLSEQVHYLDLAAKAFGTRTGGSFGGKPWADIARAAHGFLSGSYTHTEFADLAFDLEHNGGCVFGKNQMLDGNRDAVRIQLNSKKHAVSLEVLYDELCVKRSWSDSGYGYGRTRAARSGIKALSDEVEALYRKAERLGLVRQSVVPSVPQQEGVWHRKVAFDLHEEKPTAWFAHTYPEHLQELEVQSEPTPWFTHEEASTYADLLTNSEESLSKGQLTVKIAKQYPTYAKMLKKFEKPPVKEGLLQQIAAQSGEEI
jgi:hypothetical protein